MAEAKSMVDFCLDTNCDGSTLCQGFHEDFVLMDNHLIVNLNLVNCKRVAKNRYAMVSLPKGRVFYQA